MAALVRGMSGRCASSSLSGSSVAGVTALILPRLAGASGDTNGLANLFLKMLPLGGISGYAVNCVGLS